MKYILLVIAFNWFYSSYGQIKENCQLLSIVLSHEESRITFKLDSFKDMPINVIDKQGIFDKCDIDDLYERKVLIIHDSLNSRVANKIDIIIHSVKQIRNKYFIKIEQKSTGAFGNIVIQKRNKKFILSRWDVGYI